MKFRTMVILLISLFTIGTLLGPIREGNAMVTDQGQQDSLYNEGLTENGLKTSPDQLIRFHVLANSDSDEDQALKRAVRDAILKEVSPRLAASQSLDESRQILKTLRPEMERIGRSVVQAWGKDYMVRTEFGHFSFPTKSYGSLVLPAGEYEALRVMIGEAKGSNWWCVLFPPLCFVDIEHSTAVQVDGKPGIPIKNETVALVQTQAVKAAELAPKVQKTPNVRFFFWEKVKELFKL